MPKEGKTHTRAAVFLHVPPAPSLARGRDVRAAALASASFVEALSFAAFELWHIQRVLGLARDAAAGSGPGAWQPLNLPLDVQFAWAWDWDVPLQVGGRPSQSPHSLTPSSVCASIRGLPW